MNCVSYYICVYHFLFLFALFFPGWGVLPLQRDWNLSCDHGLDDAS